jgi:hypothetical protein
MVLGTSLRNIGLSVLIAVQSFPGTAVGATVAAYFLVQCIANILLARYLSRATGPTEA